MTKSSVQLRQFTLILGLAVGVSACSTIADLDPTGLLGDSSDNAPASQFPDQAAPTASDQAVGTTPDLASLPARPAPAAPADQQQTAQSLASDGAQARYSADALRGGTEAAAPPPAASEAAPSAAQQLLGAAPSDAPPTASDTPPAAAPAPQLAAAAPPPAAEPAPALRRTEAGAPSPATSSEGAAPAVPANAPVQTAALPGVAAAPVGPSAPSAAARSGEPAVPANAPMRGGAMMAQPAMSDAALGSNLPPRRRSIHRSVSSYRLRSWRIIARPRHSRAAPAWRRSLPCRPRRARETVPMAVPWSPIWMPAVPADWR